MKQLEDALGHHVDAIRATAVMTAAIGLARYFKERGDEEAMLAVVSGEWIAYVVDVAQPFCMAGLSKLMDAVERQIQRDAE